MFKDIYETLIPEDDRIGWREALSLAFEEMDTLRVEEGESDD